MHQIVSVLLFLCVTSLVILRKMSKDETLFRVKKMFSLGPQKAIFSHVLT